MTHEVIIIRTSADTFDVIVGHRLNDRPLSRAEADSPGPRVGFGCAIVRIGARKGARTG
jgi:hypothetical protein